MADQELELTWDPALFVKAVDAVVKKMTAIEDKMGEIANATNHMEKHGAMAIGAWTAVMTSALGIVSAGIRKALTFIPEIGHSFQVASDIFLRNLLWPLRQELIPLLQGMLNWVRDHRAMFVQWGQVIANVFRALKSIIAGFYETVFKIWRGVGNAILKFFGGTAKSISDLLNILLFRITVVAQFIQIALEPILNTVMSIFEKIVGYVRAVFDGIMKGASGIMEPISGIVQSFQEFLDLIDDVLGGTNMLTEAFSLLGTWLGGTVKLSIEAIAASLDLIVTGARILKALLMGDMDEVKRIGSGLIERRVAGGKRMLETANTVAEKTGEFATEHLIPGMGSNSQTANVTNNVTVVTDKPVEAVRQAVTDGTSKALSQNLKDAKIRSGANP